MKPYPFVVAVGTADSLRHYVYDTLLPSQLFARELFTTGGVIVHPLAVNPGCIITVSNVSKLSVLQVCFLPCA